MRDDRYPCFIIQRSSFVTAQGPFFFFFFFSGSGLFVICDGFFSEGSRCGFFTFFGGQFPYVKLASRRKGLPWRTNTNRARYTAIIQQTSRRLMNRTSHTMLIARSDEWCIEHPKKTICGGRAAFKSIGISFTTADHTWATILCRTTHIRGMAEQA